MCTTLRYALLSSKQWALSDIYHNIQLIAKQTASLVNKHYQNEVTLTGQNPPLKCCQPLEILAQLKTGLDLFMIKIWLGLDGRLFHETSKFDSW